MTADDGTVGTTELERRVRTLLLESADNLPASVRSRLTHARHAALGAPPARAPALRWVPAGALAALALALLIVYVPYGKGPTEAPVVGGGGLEDIELLSDNDAMPLNGDQEVDYDFYEWAAAEAGDGTSPAVGS